MTHSLISPRLLPTPGATFRASACAASLLALLASCSGGGGDDGGIAAPASPPASSYSIAVPRAWMQIAHDGARAAAFSAPQAARMYAYAGAATYEAVAPGVPQKVGLDGKLPGFGPLPALAPGQHHWPAVSNTALAAVLREMFAAEAQVLVQIDALEAQIDHQLMAALDPAVLARSVQRGLDVGAAVVLWAQADGASQWQGCAWTPPSAPGAWQPTAPGFLPPVEPCWSELRTFALIDVHECAALAPPPFDPQQGSAFFGEALEVYVKVNSLTPEELAIAEFWHDPPSATSTSAGHWMKIVDQLAEQHGLKLDVYAEALARAGLAQADATLAAWEVKYDVARLRPITFVQDPAGIGDPTWTPPDLIATPASPSHVSVQAAHAGAASVVLADLLGDLAFVDDHLAGFGVPPRSFASLTEAADEAALSRLYAGVAYRSSFEAGIDQGRCVGQVLIQALAPLP